MPSIPAVGSVCSSHMWMTRRDDMALTHQIYYGLFEHAHAHAHADDDDDDPVSPLLVRRRNIHKSFMGAGDLKRLHLRHLYVCIPIVVHSGLQ